MKTQLRVQGTDLKELKDQGTKQAKAREEGLYQQSVESVRLRAALLPSQTRDHVRARPRERSSTLWRRLGTDYDAGGLRCGIAQMA